MAMGVAVCLACQQPAAPRVESSATPNVEGADSGSAPPSPAQDAQASPRPLPPVEVPDPMAWALEMARVEEVRGTRDTLSVPPELQHHTDRRRFLAVQMADSREESYELPHDQGELAQMVLSGEVVELAAMGDDHLLYEVGTDAREDPLSHFDPETGKDVPLLPSLAAYEAEDARLAAEMEGRGRGAAEARERRERLTRYYGNAALRDELFAEHEAVTTLATNFGGVSYDLTVPEERARFQVRMLSFVRPEARDIVLSLAREYHARFDRLLPITSLIRTERYQRRLARGNANATHVDIPPHATGMAFDISYKFMAHDEQNFLMEQVAALERESRVEALRERRNHLHIYAFADGLPSEPMIAGFLADVEAAHPGSAPGARLAAAQKSKKAAIRRASNKAKKTAAARKARPRARRAR
jgi:hypothetical protein